MSNHIAIFIDAENLTSWVKNGGVETLMDELRSLGQVVVRKAYGKWSTTQLAPLQSVLNENGFELIHTFHPATGDSDFSPLFRKLREQGKDVIGVGPKSPLSECVKNSCSRYIYTDNADEENADETERNNMLVSEKIDFIDILQSILQEEDGSIHLSALKSKMLERDNARDNAFSEKRLGFKTFKDFVNATDFAEIKDDGNGTLVVSLVKKKVNVQEDAQMTLAKILKKKGWDVFPKVTLRKIFKLVCDKTAQKSKSKQALVQEIASKNMVGTTSGIINRVLGIFYKAKLVKINGTEEEKLWKIEKNNKYWYEIDKAMLDRLAAGLKDAGFKAKESEIKALLYGRYTTDDEVHSLLSAYRGVIE